MWILKHHLDTHIILALPVWVEHLCPGMTHLPVLGPLQSALACPAPVSLSRGISGKTIMRSQGTVFLSRRSQLESN